MPTHFIQIGGKAVIVLGIIATLTIWAVVWPDSFSATIDTALSAIQGAYNGATGAL